MAEQRYEVSREIESGKYEALIEIGPQVLDVRPGEMFVNADKVDDAAAVRFQAKSAGAQMFRRLLEVLLDKGVQLQRFEKKGLSPLEITQIQQRVALKPKALTRLDPATGAFVDAADETPIINLFLPAVLIGLMFMVVMVGATPAMHGIIEEKSQRIAEVLLGSVTPFQLMAGKLLGVVGVALTMALVYLAGGYFLAWYFGFAGVLPSSLLAWFLPMLVLALLIFGSLFIAVGAAAADIKDTQTLLMPIMMFACLPMLALGPIMQDPNGIDRPRRLVLPVRHADAAGGAAIGAAGGAGVGDGGGHRPGAGDDGTVRLGRGPHLPRRHPDAGIGATVRGFAALGGAGVVKI